MNKRIFLMTGASSDIGLETIRSWPQDGSIIIAQYHTNASQLERLRSENPERELHLIRADLVDESSVQNLIQEIQKSHGHLDGLIHLAAPKAATKRLKDLQWGDLQNHLDVQLKSAHLILKHFLPEMSRRKWGKVIFILSSYTLGVPPMAMAHYVSAKYALLGYMKALVSEFRTRGICINAVSPSMIDTKFISEVPDLVKNLTIESHPLKRLAKTEDVAPLIHFLLSEKSDYLSGANIPVAGGEVF